MVTTPISSKGSQNKENNAETRGGLGNKARLYLKAFHVTVYFARSSRCFVVECKNEIFKTQAKNTCLGIFKECEYWRSTQQVRPHISALGLKAIIRNEKTFNLLS